MQITTVKTVLIFMHGCRNGYPDQFPSWFFSGAPLIRIEHLNRPQLLRSQFQFSIYPFTAHLIQYLTAE